MYKDCFYASVCEKECQGECNDCRHMQLLLDHGKIPKKFQHPHKMIPQPCDEKAYESLYDIASNIVDFVDDGKSLYIHSANTGNGKTTWAIRMLLNYFHWAKDYYFEELVGAFVNVPEFLYQCKSEIQLPTTEFAKFKKSLFDCKLLVLDDICVHKSSDFDMTFLYTLINHRVADGLSTIYTSNVLHKDLKNQLDSRIVSRISQSIMVEFKGKDER
jgi:DNA replication protein DnaC